MGYFTYLIDLLDIHLLHFQNEFSNTLNFPTLYDSNYEILNKTMSFIATTFSSGMLAPLPPKGYLVIGND